MAGRVQWEAQVDSNVAKLLSETKELRDQLDGIKKGNYEIKLNIDDKKLEKVISNLDKMLESLGRGTGDFKEFENLSKQLNEIVSEVKELNKAFGGINNSGVSNLLSSIQSIDKSLSSLSEHITNVNKDFGSVGKNASDNVGQINEAKKATEGLTEATRELANAQKNVGNKSNISSGNEIVESQNKIQEELKETREQAEKTLEAIEKVTVYRGTNGGNPLTANKNGATFWDSKKDIAKLYGTDSDDKTLWSSQISIKNPLTIDAQGSKYGDITYLGDGIEETSKKIIELTEREKELRTALQNSTDSGEEQVKMALELSNVCKEIKSISDDISNPYGTHATDWWVDYAKQNGYDGIHFKNVIDTPDSYAKENAELSDVYVTLQKEQIENATLLAKANHELAESERQVALAQLGVIESQNTPIKDTFQGDKFQETVSVADKLEEEIQEITVATDKAGKALEEYKEKWKVLKQVGDVGDDKYSATFEKNAGQIESVVWKAKRDADGNVLFDSNGEKEYEMLSVTISNYQKLESVIVSADNELRKLEDRRQNLLKQNPTASTSGLDAQIAYQKNYISLLEQTVKHISQADEYLLEEQQIIEARNKAEKEYQLTKGSKQDESVAKDYQKRNDAIIKANRLLNTQEKTVEHIAKTYDKALNPDLEKSVNNPNDLAELAQKKSEIQTLINQLKNAPRDASNEQEYLKLEKLIAEYKDLADYKKKANNPTKQELGGQKLETLVAQTVAEYDKLIIRAEKYGDATKEIVEKLRQQRDLLAQTDSNGKYTTNANDFYSARDVLKVQKADFGVFEAEAKSAKKSDIDMANQKLEEQKRIYKELNNEIDRYATVSKRIANGKALSSDEEELAKLQSRIEELQNEPILSKEQLEASQLRLEKLEATLEDIQEITRNNNIDSMQSEIDAYNKRYNNLNIKPSDKNRSDDYQKAIDNYKTSIEELETFLNRLRTSSAPITEEIENQWNEITLKVDKASDAVKAFSAAEKGSDEDGRMKEIDKLTKYLDKNTRISKEAKQQLQGYLKLLKSGDPSVNIKKIHTAWTEVAVAEREAGREGKKFWDIITDKALYGQAAQLAGYYLSLTDFIRYAQNGIQTIRELDSALAEMRKVSDESASSLKNLQDVSFDLADSVGTTAIQIQNSIADFMRIGDSAEEARKHALDANTLLQVSEFDNIEDATSALVSMNQAWKDVDTQHINDVLNILGNNMPIATDELASSLQRSAGTLATLGATLEEAAALTVAGNSILQDPDSVAAGLRTIELRMVGTTTAKDELQALGEDVDDFVVQTESKLRESIMNLTKVASNGYKGFDILDENGNYKSFYERMLGLSEIYEEIQEQDKKLGNNSATALIELIAGKNRSAIAGAVLSSPEILKESYDLAMKAEGSSAEELAKALDTIDAKFQQLSNQAQEFWYKLIDSDTIKNGITLLTELLGLATDFVDTFGALGTAGVGIGAYLGIKNAGICV